MMNPQRKQPIPGTRSHVIVKAAYRMARIYTRLFSHILHTAALSELVIQAGVEAAEARCREEQPGRKITLSKLSMMTGVPTNIIKDMQQRPKSMADFHVCAEAAILERWAKDPALRSKATGEPIDLPIFGNDGSFQSLVNRHAGRGISTRTALDRLESTGNVKIVNKHFVRMIDPIWRFIEDNEDECLDYGTQALNSLAHCIENNVINRHDYSKKFTERRICSFRVEDTMENRQKINQLLLQQKEEMIQLMESLEQNSDTVNETMIGTGYYFWSSKEHQTYN